MLETEYIFILVIVGMVAAIVILVRYGLRSKADADRVRKICTIANP